MQLRHIVLRRAKKEYTILTLEAIILLLEQRCEIPATKFKM